MRLDTSEESISQPLAFSSAATEASVEEDNFDGHDFHDFEGLDWGWSKRFVAPLSTPRGKSSWIFKHGWRFWKEGTHQPIELYFVCKHCHINRLRSGVHRVTTSTSAANSHLRLDKIGHRIRKDGKIFYKPRREAGQQLLRQARQRGLTFSLETHQTLGNFDLHGFR